MFDEVFKPAPRKGKRNDNTSETSSTKGNNAVPITSPSRSSIKGLHNEEPTKKEARENPSPVVASRNSSNIRVSTSNHNRKGSSDEDLPSPAVKNIGFAKVAKSKE